jgi:hypothetical protein
MESQSNWPEKIVGPGGSWLPPAGRCPAVQEWHGIRGTSSRLSGPEPRLSEGSGEYGRSGRGVRAHHEGRKGVKELCGGRPRYLKKRDRKKLRRDSTGNVNETLRKTAGMEIAKQISITTDGLRTIKDRTLWRGRSPPKRKTLY